MEVFKRLGGLCLGIFFLFFSVTAVSADQLSDLTDKINKLQEQIAAAQTQQKTLAGQIVYMDNQISLTTTKISLTEEKLTRLSKSLITVSEKINSLEEALKKTSEVLTNRLITTYKTGRTDAALTLFFSSDLQNYTTRLSYLKLVAEHDRALLEQMALTRENYHGQKNELTAIKNQQEELKNQLKSQQLTLSRQKKDKQVLLEATKSDEIRYRQLLSQAQSELDGLRSSQFTGKRHVGKGEVIGLMGSTGFSTGPHLHFGVYNLSEGNSSNFSYYDNAVNPYDVLSGKTVRFEARSCDDTPSATSKSVGNGSMDWPMKDPGISQCYGHTPWSWMYGAINFHHGIDMYNFADMAVRAADEGEAYFYRGTSSFGNNVRIFHSNGKMTLYLHLQ